MDGRSDSGSSNLLLFRLARERRGAKKRGLSLSPFSMANVSAAEVQKFLKGVDYPARKEDLVSKAREEGAPKEVIDEINRMPGNEFNSPSDLMKGYEGMD